jgi:hypothetical protein
MPSARLQFARSSSIFHDLYSLLQWMFFPQSKHVPIPQDRSMVGKDALVSPLLKMTREKDQVTANRFASGAK